MYQFSNRLKLPQLISLMTQCETFFLIIKPWLVYFFRIFRNIDPEHNYIAPQEPALPEVTLIDVLTNNNTATKVNTNVKKCTII